VYFDNEVNVNDLRLPKMTEDAQSSFLWRDVEKAHIEKILKLFKGNQRKTQTAIGYGSINTLVKKIEEYGINAKGI
jgi:DNA-binding NtrC family response regulator